MLEPSTSPKVSIIIPVYNAEQFLPSCTESILSQDFTDWEAVFIDDGSIDKSLVYLKSVESADKRIRVFSKQNNGVSSARNLGLDKARGEWICFVDADDRLTKNALSLLLQKAEDTDMVLGGYEVFDEEHTLTYSIPDRLEYRLNQYQALEQLFRPWHYRWLGEVWGKLFKASIIKRHQLKFDERIHIGEDRLFVTAYTCHIQSAFLFTAPVYEYTENRASAMASFEQGESRHFMTDLDSLLEIKRLMLKVPDSETFLSQLKKQAINHYHHICERNGFKGFKGLRDKLNAHWILLRILSLKDYLSVFLFKKSDL